MRSSQGRPGLVVGRRQHRIDLALAMIEEDFGHTTAPASREG
jgi:hypothetical protein